MLKVGTTSTFVAVFLGLAVFVSSHTSGAEKNCECDFSEAPWEAYGTKAACTTWTRESRRSCEIAFGGLGAEPDLVAQVLGRDPKEYLDDVYTTIQSYFAALQANDTKTLTSPEFVQHVLPIFMRGAFLREPVT